MVNQSDFVLTESSKKLLIAPNASRAAVQQNNVCPEMEMTSALNSPPENPIDKYEWTQLDEGQHFPVDFSTNHGLNSISIDSKTAEISS